MCHYGIFSEEKKALIESARLVSVGIYHVGGVAGDLAVLHLLIVGMGLVRTA